MSDDILAVFPEIDLATAEAIGALAEEHLGRLLDEHIEEEQKMSLEAEAARKLGIEYIPADFQKTEKNGPGGYPGRGLVCPLSVRWYVLEPGDGTRYCMFLVPFTQPGYSHHVFVGTDPYTHIGVGIVMPGSQAFYEMHLGSLDFDQWEKTPDSLSDAVSYYVGHTGGRMHHYTVAACLLAASVLKDRSADIAGACEAMLKAREWDWDRS